jgi:hypothetical protein
MHDQKAEVILLRGPGIESASVVFDAEADRVHILCQVDLNSASPRVPNGISEGLFGHLVDSELKRRIRYMDVSDGLFDVHAGLSLKIPN